jgi:hypothetical protein
MPISITFVQDPESHFPIHEGFLMNRKYRPPSEVLREAKLHNIDYRHFLNGDNQDTGAYVPQKLMIEWMYDFINDFQNAMNFERFHFEFAYYMAMSYGTKENEFVSRASCPMWFVTIRDFEQSIVHKNWTIAFDDWADILIKRGPATREDPMSNAPNFTHCEVMKQKLFSAIKEHIRLRNFRLEREKNKQ